MTPVDIGTPLPSSVPSVRLSGLDCRVTFTLSRDLVLALEDQARCMGKPFPEYLEECCNIALANYIGIG